MIEQKRGKTDEASYPGLGIDIKVQAQQPRYHIRDPPPTRKPDENLVSISTKMPCPLPKHGTKSIYMSLRVETGWQVTYSKLAASFDAAASFRSPGRRGAMPCCAV